MLQDGTSTTGVAAFKEFWYTMVGFASDAQGFDGNGSYTRTATGGGDLLIRTGKLSNRPRLRDVLYGHALVRPQGTRPSARRASRPTTPIAPATRTRLPNLNGPAAAAGPPDRVAQEGK